MNLRYLLILLLLSTCKLLDSGIAWGTPTPPTFAPERSVYIQGVIQRNNLEPLGVRILELADTKTLPGDRQPIDIIINSPGGEVYSGLRFLNYMREVTSRGYTMRCFVGHMAASLAFQILLYCNQRFALSGSILLWHRVRAFYRGAITAPAARDIALALQRIDNYFEYDLFHVMTEMPKALIKYHREHETMHIAKALSAEMPQFIQTYDNIPNLLEADKMSQVLTSRMPFIFGDIDIQDPEILYIYKNRKE